MVFGASGGIGSEVCRILCEEGATVTGLGRDPAKLSMHPAFDGLKQLACDATNLTDVLHCFQEVQQQIGAIDGVVNCAGSLLLKPAHQTTADEWNDTLATNLSTAFNIVHAAAKSMSTTGGSVVLMSSAAARVGLANHEAIAAAKAGVIGLTLAAAATYASRGLRVNCIAPGLVQTPMTESLTSSDIAMKASNKMHPIGRIGKPSDVANSIAWLLDRRQSWITGQVIGVDGGLATVRSRL